MASKIEKLWNAVKVLVFIWGALALLGALGALVFFSYSMTIGNCTLVDKASVDDAAHILNWCELDPQRIESISHSYISKRSFTGDHLDVFAVKMKSIPQKDLDSGKFDSTKGWYRGDRLPREVAMTVDLLGEWTANDTIKWFPTAKELRSKDVYVYPVMIHLWNMKPTATDIVFLRPQDNMLFYASFKM